MVFCEICKINTPNFKLHETSQKHQNGGKKAPKENKLTADPNYFKNYYIKNNLKEKYSNKKHCDICDKGVAIYNWSKHTQTEKHCKKINIKDDPYIINKKLIDEEPIILNDE